jgi:hypothetical protein
MSSNSHTAAHAAHARHDSAKPSSIGDEISGMRDSLSEGVQGVTESGRRVIGAASATARRAIGNARDAGLEYRDRVGKTIADRPLQSVAIAAAAGAVVMGLFLLLRRK